MFYKIKVYLRILKYFKLIFNILKIDFISNVLSLILYNYFLKQS